MTYEEAKNISQYIEGAIKCTYVRFYYDFGGRGNPDDIRHLFSLQSKQVTGMSVEVRPSIAKEIPFGREVPRTLVRVNIEEPVAEAVSKWIKNNPNKDFSYLMDKLQYDGNLYVCANAVEWDKMEDNLIEQVIEEEQIVPENQQKNKKKLYWLAAAAAVLLLNN